MNLSDVLWHAYTGAPPDVVARPASAQAEADFDLIRASVPRWTRAAYRSLSGSQPQPQFASGATTLTSVFTAEPSLAERTCDKGNRTGEERLAAIDAYIYEVQVSGKRITRKDIWEAAGYTSRVEFERWQRNDTKHPKPCCRQKIRRYPQT